MFFMIESKTEIQVYNVLLGIVMSAVTFIGCDLMFHPLVAVAMALVTGIVFRMVFRPAAKHNAKVLMRAQSMTMVNVSIMVISITVMTFVNIVIIGSVGYALVWLGVPAELAFPMAIFASSFFDSVMESKTMKQYSAINTGTQMSA